MYEQLLTWFFNLLVLVWKMRQSQKAFFKERLREDLVESKRLEGEVDKALKRHLEFDRHGKPIALVFGVGNDDAPEPAQERLL